MMAFHHSILSNKSYYASLNTSKAELVVIREHQSCILEWIFEKNKSPLDYFSSSIRIMRFFPPFYFFYDRWGFSTKRNEMQIGRDFHNFKSRFALLFSPLLNFNSFIFFIHSIFIKGIFVQHKRNFLFFSFLNFLDIKSKCLYAKLLRIEGKFYTLNRNIFNDKIFDKFVHVFSYSYSQPKYYTKSILVFLISSPPTRHSILSQ